MLEATGVAGQGVNKVRKTSQVKIIVRVHNFCFQTVAPGGTVDFPENAKHLYTIYVRPTLETLGRRCTMLYKCFVFAGTAYFYHNHLI